MPYISPCRSRINNWVSRKTENRINALLPPESISENTRLVLTNAIYFKANRYYPFSVSNTAEGLFYLRDGSSVTTSLIRRSLIASYKEVAGEYQAVILPYQSPTRAQRVFIY